MLRRKPPALLAFLLALSLFVPFVAVLQAAVAHVATTEFNDGAASSTTLVSGSITTSAGELLVLLVVSASQTTSTVGESGGGTFTKRGELQNGASASAAIWSLPNASGGSHTYTVTFAGASAYDSAWLMRVSGAATSAELDGSCATATGSSTTPASGSFTTAGTSFLAGVESSNDTSSAATTPGSGWTQPTNYASGVNIGSVDYKANPGGTSHTADFTTDTAGDWAAVGCGFKVAGAAGGTRPCLLSLLGVGSC